MIYYLGYLFYFSAAYVILFPGENTNGETNYVFYFKIKHIRINQETGNCL